MTCPNGVSPVKSKRNTLIKSGDTRRDRRTSSGSPIVDANLLRENTHRYGAAVKEYIVGYCGIDNANGMRLSRSLKRIESYKSSGPRNDAQHAGFAAENLEVSHRRAEARIEGKRPTAQRTDDIPGHYNDENYDITSKLDKSGNPIPEYSEQLKFVGGGNAKETVKSLLSKGYAKYRNGEGKITIAKDQYGGVKAELKARSQRLNASIAKHRKSGDVAGEAKARIKLEEIDKLEKLLKQGSITTWEAKCPRLATISRISGTALKAGAESALPGAGYAAAMSTARNIVSVFMGEKQIGEAAADVAKDAVVGGAATFATAAGTSIISGFAKNSTEKIVRKLGNANVAACVTTSTIEVARILKRLFNDEITPSNAVMEIGESTVGISTSIIFGKMFKGLGKAGIKMARQIIGSGIIAPEAAGALICSLAGAIVAQGAVLALRTMGSAVSLMLTRGEASRRRRTEIEEECGRMVRRFDQAAARIQALHEKYLDENYAYYSTLFTALSDASQSGDIDGYIDRVNIAILRLGGNPMYKNKCQFDALMLDSKSKLEL